jgi:hypothetical protein
MLETRSIDRNIDLVTAADYAALRAEGISHLQKLSGAIWTDHNTHDPGITTLEILCYALTDLAYRTGFETRDLMADDKGRMDPASLSGLAPAHEVLTTAPRTIADYRRLLLRIEGLRNAWLDPMTDAAHRQSEVPIYADCLADGLGFDPVNAAGEPTHPVKVSGLYKVLIELEIDDLLGSMNETALTYQVRRGPLKGAALHFDSSDPALADGSLDLGVDLKKVDAIRSFAKSPEGYAVHLRLGMQRNRQVDLGPCVLRVREDRARADRPALSVTDQEIKKILLASDGDDLVPLFWEKQQRRARALAAVGCALHAHRGLCEDFLSIDTVAPFQIGICADIEVKADADLEEVQAKVYHEIEKYLSAPVRYRTLEEMLSEGRQPDEIFNGPFVDFEFKCGDEPIFTKPGFITDDDLAASELRRKVYASDIINLVVDIDGVEAIRNLQILPYDKNGRAMGPAAKWTLDVPPDHQPVFFMEASKILFHKAGIPYRAQPTEFKRTLDHLRAMDRREVYVAPDQILPVPVGNWRNLDIHYPVQHDFPGTYKIGAAGISDTEDHRRIAKARQLKGYLAFFDQILADYLGQLANLRRLFSLDRGLGQTYFSQYVTDIAGSLDVFEDEFYIDKAKLSDDVVRTRLTETEEAFLERRNRLLDHLIARFAERFSDYALLSFRLSGDRLKTSAQLIDDKIDFLSEYPRISRNRGQGANIRPSDPADVWDSENISGLERRAGRLLGIDKLMRRDLNCGKHFADLFATRKSGNQFHVVIRDRDRKELFSSRQSFASRPAALAAAAKIYPGMRDEDAYRIAATQGATTFVMSLVSGNSTLTHSKLFDTELDAAVAARAIVERYDEVLASGACDVEGMHLVEHILLRPLARGDKLMTVCLQDECAFCGEEDPYSFRVSVVLPYWPERFRNLHFRALLERTLREEAPAHVQVKVCWVGQQQMTEFDKAHLAWLKARGAKTPNPATVRNAARKLILILEGLKTVYPAASLHDCDAGEDETMVRLGTSALGIF